MCAHLAGAPTSNIERELATQPACWQTIIDDRAADVSLLPSAGSRVAAAGCGTSLYMARAYAGLREQAGHGETDAFPASEFPRNRRYDHVVVLSRSGTTTEVVDLLTDLHQAATTTTAIVAAPGTPVAELATHAVVLEHAAERSIVQTRFPTTALALVRLSLGDDLTRPIADAESALVDPLPVDAGVEQITFLGTGWTVGIADEAALKCREAAGFWTESYPAMEYRHGPISVSGPSSIVWAFGPVPDDLADDVRATGAQFVHTGADPMAELIRAQRLAVRLAHRSGRDPDQPRALTFSVVLDSARP